MIHMREHEYGLDYPQMRIWTNEMEYYGRFVIVPNNEAKQFKCLLDKLGIGYVTIHHCQTGDECKCKKLKNDEWPY